MKRSWLSRAFLVSAFCCVVVHASNEHLVITAVYAKTANGYARKKNPDGTVKREFYALSNGGPIKGTGKDRDMADVTFPELANVLGQNLAKQNYYLAHDAKSADLLLVVNWGKTLPSEGPTYASNLSSAATSLASANAAHAQSAAIAAQEAISNPSGTTTPPTGDESAARTEFQNSMDQIQIENAERDRMNGRTAEMLGYVTEVWNSDDEIRVGARGDYYQQLISDLEEPRYYVVITAYDFKEATAAKKLKPLWVTRVSMRAPGANFARGLTTMLSSAGKQFGRDSHRLLRDVVPEGSVEIGATTVVGNSANAPEAAPRKP
jgi:hypothetical protein